MQPVSSATSRPDRFGVFDSRRIRLVLGAISAVVLLFIVSMRGLAQFYTDYLWFKSLDLKDVWQQVLVAKVLLVAIFACIFFVLLWVNLYIADRLAPASRPPTPEEEMLVRYREAVKGRAWLVRLAVSAVFAFMAVSEVVNRWEEWLLFVNHRDFGVTDPLFNTDIGFYVFRLPFATFAVGWAFASFVIIFIVTCAAHFLNGGIRMPVAGVKPEVGSKDERVLPSVKVHLSAILAVLAVLKAAGYQLAKYELTLSTHGVVDGALYTDVKARWPALNLLVLISLFAAVLLLWNLRRRGWVLPVLAVGLWAFVALVMGNMYPSFVQRFRVDPNETAKEADYASYNISATRTAYSLTPDVDVSRQTFNYEDDLDPDQIRAADKTVRQRPDPRPFHPHRHVR